MTLASKYDGKCKDCGKSHKIGDMIDQNDNDHWCIDGKNCMGTMQLQGSPRPQAEPVKRTAEELRKKFLQQYDGSLSTIIEAGEKKGIEVIGTYIGVLEACESMGITNPITQGMIMNNVIRRMQ